MINWMKRLFGKEGVKSAGLSVLTLTRNKGQDKCILGELKNFNGQMSLKTLELPFRDNKSRISSIPAGLYVCKYHDGFKFKDVWEVTGVFERDAILIHAGNTVDDIEGCILVGVKHGILKGKSAVLQSREAMNCLRNYIGRDEVGRLKSFLLNIIEV